MTDRPTTTRRGSLAVLGATAAAALSPRITSAQAARQTIRIGTIPTQIGAACYYAKDLGSFERAGIDAQVQSLSNGAAVLAAVVSNALDVGFTNPISLAIAHEKGLPVTVVAGAGVADAKKPSNGILVVALGAPLRTAKDLDGKTIGVSGLGNINHLAVRAWLDDNGGDSKSVKYVELTLPQMTPAVESGRVDAAAMDVAGVASARGRVREIGSTYDAYGPLFLASYWFASTEWIAKNADLAKRFAGIVRETGAWANAHPHEANVIWARNSKYALSDLEAVAPPIYATAITPAMLQPCIDVAAKYAVIQKAFPARELISSIAQ